VSAVLVAVVTPPTRRERPPATSWGPFLCRSGSVRPRGRGNPRKQCLHTHAWSRKKKIAPSINANGVALDPAAGATPPLISAGQGVIGWLAGRLDGVMPDCPLHSYAWVRPDTLADEARRRADFRHNLSPLTRTGVGVTGWSRSWATSRW
jgi:hypothetical protein